tara:strand:+ start:573 stop:926 length:354 start_codon:yes stop_codon:yes gene_type:complete
MPKVPIQNGESVFFSHSVAFFSNKVTIWQSRIASGLLTGQYVRHCFKLENSITPLSRGSSTSVLACLCAGEAPVLVRYQGGIACVIFNRGGLGENRICDNWREYSRDALRANHCFGS